MPDWLQLVRERLGALGISPQRDDEIATELADYLEDRFADDDSATYPGEVANWAHLKRDLRHASLGDAMNDRIRSLWIPGVFTLLAAFALWRILLLAGFAPRLIWVNQQKFAFLYLYIPWLVALPLLGAAGAFWSRRRGARPMHRALVSLFPALGASLVFALGLAMQLVANPSNLAKNIVGVSLIIVSFVVIPGVALLLGALPFLRDSSQSTPKPI